MGSRSRDDGPITEDELTNALARINGKSDMLPPREDDKAAGRLATGFARGLAERVAGGAHTFERVQVVAVPKSGLSTRPAAIMSLEDRALFEVLVARTRAKVEKRLLSEDRVLWPRGVDVTPSYGALDSAPLAKGGGYVVFGDVAGFYESIDHQKLRERLADAGVAADTSDGIIDLLANVMGTHRGLPQGISSSDTLATLYLSPVDAELGRRGIEFWRHGDDYRIWAATWPTAVRAAHVFESALRLEGLLANSRKLRAQKFSTYSEGLDDLEHASETFRQDMEAARLDAIEDMPDEELLELANSVELDEDIQWRYFYHGIMSMDELKTAFAPFLTPKSQEIIEAIFKDAVSTDPAVLSDELRHARLVFALRRLAASKSQVPLKYVGALLLSDPDETQDISNYLIAVARVAPSEVASACLYALTATAYMTDWQRAWILRALSHCGNVVAEGMLQILERDIKTDEHGYLPRIEAARVLAVNARLDRQSALDLHAKCGRALQADLVGVIAANRGSLRWSEDFLQAARSDHLAKVVIEAIDSRK